jgi:energy-coupling factor transporter transmembrane protein EcfT
MVSMASLATHLPFSWQDLLPKSVAGFILAVVGLLVLRNIVTRTLRWRRLRHIPGPAICGWTSLWLTWNYNRGTIPFKTVEIFEEYGKIDGMYLQWEQ